MSSEQLMAAQTEPSLVCSSAERMVMQMVLMTEHHLVQLTEILKETSWVF